VAYIAAQHPELRCKSHHINFHELYIQLCKLQLLYERLWFYRPLREYSSWNRATRRNLTISSLASAQLPPFRLAFEGYDGNRRYIIRRRGVSSSPSEASRWKLEGDQLFGDDGSQMVLRFRDDSPIVSSFTFPCDGDCGDPAGGFRSYTGDQGLMLVWANPRFIGGISQFCYSEKGDDQGENQVFALSEPFPYFGCQPVKLLIDFGGDYVQGQKLAKTGPPLFRLSFFDERGAKGYIVRRRGISPDPREASIWTIDDDQHLLGVDDGQVVFQGNPLATSLTYPCYDDCTPTSAFRILSSPDGLRLLWMHPSFPSGTAQWCLSKYGNENGPDQVFGWSFPSTPEGFFRINLLVEFVDNQSSVKTSKSAHQKILEHDSRKETDREVIYLRIETEEGSFIGHFSPEGFMWQGPPTPMSLADDKLIIYDDCRFAARHTSISYMNFFPLCGDVVVDTEFSINEDVLEWTNGDFDDDKARICVAGEEIFVYFHGPLPGTCMPVKLRKYQFDSVKSIKVDYHEFLESNKAVHEKARGSGPIYLAAQTEDGLVGFLTREGTLMLGDEPQAYFLESGELGLDPSMLCRFGVWNPEGNFEGFKIRCGRMLLWDREFSFDAENGNLEFKNEYFDSEGAKFCFKYDNREVIVVIHGGYPDGCTPVEIRKSSRFDKSEKLSKFATSIKSNGRNFVKREKTEEKPATFAPAVKSHGQKWLKNKESKKAGDSAGRNGEIAGLEL
jgi:hypothetical protein